MDKFYDTNAPGITLNDTFPCADVASFVETTALCYKLCPGSQRSRPLSATIDTHKKFLPAKLFHSY
jgi:hypothetical protein